jgi:hypothetical protein
MSGPGAPYAREGTHTGIILWGNNPITQVVNPRAMTILNITEMGHRYYYGTVAIRVTSYGFIGSNINIVGQGTGEHALENELSGTAFFGGVAGAIAGACQALMPGV